MSGGEPRVYRCGSAARWLPRALAAAVLGVALVAAGGIDPTDRLGLTRPLRIFVVMSGAVSALWLMRKGAELRLRVHVNAGGLGLERGAWKGEIGFDDLDRLEYETPLATSRSWIPALVLRERNGTGWRVPALLGAGDRLIVELIERSGRKDLAAWADVLRLRRRMGRPGTLTLVGYGVVVAFLVAGWALYTG